MRCLRAISVVRLSDRVRNESLRTDLHMNTTITYTIKPKCSSGLALARRSVDSYVARANHLDFPNPRPRGRPPKKLCTQIHEDTGLTLATTEHRESERLEP